MSADSGKGDVVSGTTAAAKGFIRRGDPWAGGLIGTRVFGVKPDNPGPITFTGTNSWVIASPESGTCAVVDPCPSGEHIERILALCDRLRLKVAAILVTHHHPDHIEGIPELVARTGASVYTRDTAPIDALAESSGVRIAAERIDEGPFDVLGPEVPIEIVALPGHSPDSVGFFLPQERSMITGDIVFNQSPTVLPYPDGDVGDYFATLEKLDRLLREGLISCLIPGHGHPIYEVERILRASRVHRERRLQQIADTLASGVPAEPEAVFQAAYAQQVRPGLHDLSLQGIRTQLDYLQRMSDQG